VIKQALQGNNATEQSGSIFSAFACKGQQPVKPSNQAHSNPEVQPTWSGGSQRTTTQFGLLKTSSFIFSCQLAVLSSTFLLVQLAHVTLLQNTKKPTKSLSSSCRICLAVFISIQTLGHHPTTVLSLPGQCSLTLLKSPRYIYYLLFGFMLMAFKSHIGAILAKVFQAMLLQNRLTDKILACNNDNASSNNTQAIKLTKLPNMFEET